jgi:antitoxin component of MazEF toxin-antitoxin module
MIKKLLRTTDGVALILDDEILDQLGVRADSEVELSIADKVLLVVPIDHATREKKFRSSVGKVNQKFAGLFRRQRVSGGSSLQRCVRMRFRQ